MKYLAVPDGYRCPLCPDHQDEQFGRHPLLAEPLCQGCLIELDHYARFPLDALSPRKQVWAETFSRLADRSWDDCRRAILSSEIATWEAIEQDHAGSWWRVMMRGNRWTEAMCEALVAEKLAELRAALATVPRVSEAPSASDDLAQ
jgi:hypothetical protein